MKIQINSLAALERLIGDDKEMEITVKSSIINEFAKSYIKSVANSEIVNTIKNAVLEEVKKTNYFGLLERRTSSHWSTEYLLSKDAKELVKTQVRREMDQLISETVGPIREEIVDDIRGRLDLMSLSVSQCIREEVQKETIEKLVQKRLKDLLNKATNNLKNNECMDK